MQQNTTIEILMARFGGQVLVPFVDAAESIGIAQQTARNRLSKGTFPIPTVMRGARRFIHLADLARYIDSLRGNTTSKRGRPPKSRKLGELQ